MKRKYSAGSCDPPGARFRLWNSGPRVLRGRSHSARRILIVVLHRRSRERTQGVPPLPCPFGEDWLTFNVVSGRRAMDDFAACGFEIAGHRRGDTVARDVRLEARIEFERSLGKWARALGHADACTYGIRDDEIDQMIGQAGKVFFPSGPFAFITGNHARGNWVESKVRSAHLDFSLGALKGTNERFSNRLACSVADTLESGWREHLERVMRWAQD